MHFAASSEPKEKRMSKSLLVAACAGALTVTGLSAVANYQSRQTAAEPVQIISSKPLVEHYSVNEQQCHNQVKTRQKAVKDQDQVAGTALGAVVGGLLGSQVGNGDGKKLATVAGAIAGGYTGKQTQKQMQQQDVEQYSEQVCQTVPRQKEKVVGYEVRFLHDGKLMTVKRDQAPKEPLYWNDGQLISKPSPTTPNE